MPISVCRVPKTPNDGQRRGAHDSQPGTPDSSAAHGDVVAHVLVQLRQGGRTEHDLAGRLQAVPGQHGRRRPGAFGLAPMTGTVRPSILNVAK